MASDTRTVDDFERSIVGFCEPLEQLLEREISEKARSSIYFFDTCMIHPVHLVKSVQPTSFTVLAPIITEQKVTLSF